MVDARTSDTLSTQVIKEILELFFQLKKLARDFHEEGNTLFFPGAEILFHSGTSMDPASTQ